MIARRIVLISVVMLIGISQYPLHSQDMYKELKSQHLKYRASIGLQILEPTGINLQLFKGYFCTGDNTYATSLIWELSLGLENAVLTSNKSYGSGKWASGGTQASLMIYYPFFTLPLGNLTLQAHIGSGLQGGVRKYETEGMGRTDNIVGGNLSIRSSITGRAIDLNDRIWFLTYFADVKFHQQFNEKFSFIRPSIGIAFRKVR